MRWNFEWKYKLFFKQNLFENVICKSATILYRFQFVYSLSWWRHQIITLSALLALCQGNPSIIVGFPSQRPATRSFGVFFDLRLNKRLSKQSKHQWFETPSRSLWRHYNVMPYHKIWSSLIQVIPDCKVHEANMGPTWVPSAPDGPHVGPMNLVIRDGLFSV